MSWMSTRPLALSSPPVNTGSIPELAATFKQRIAYSMDGYNRICTPLLALLFQVGHDLQASINHLMLVSPAAFHYKKRLLEGDHRSGLKQLFQTPQVSSSVMSDIQSDILPTENWESEFPLLLHSGF